MSTSKNLLTIGLLGGAGLLAIRALGIGGGGGGDPAAPTPANRTMQPTDPGSGAIGSDRPSEGDLDNVTPSPNPGLTPTDGSQTGGETPTPQRPGSRTDASPDAGYSVDNEGSEAPDTRANTTMEPVDAGSGSRDAPSEADLDNVTASESSSSSRPTSDYEEPPEADYTNDGSQFSRARDTVANAGDGPADNVDAENESGYSEADIDEVTSSNDDGRDTLAEQVNRNIQRRIP